MSTVTMHADHPELNEAAVARLVRTFYGRAREDEMLGPIFNRAVSDWEHHIAQIAAFWASLMLGARGYTGRPMRPHLMLGLAPAHFDRWLALFEETARAQFSADVADAFAARARRIADSFEMGIATTRGEMSAPRHSVDRAPRKGDI